VCCNSYQTMIIRGVFMYALITGASSGIGKELAKQLALKNYDLIIVARRIEQLNQLKEEICKTSPVDVVVKQCDLSAPENCIKLVEECREYHVTLVVNNAGFGKVGRFEEIPLEEELRMISTNITALHIFTKLFSQSMEQGLILNVGSIAGFQPDPMMSAYGASKAYVIKLSRAVNYEFKKHGKNVHLSVLCPGPVDTEFNKVANCTFNLRSISPKKCAKIALKGLFKKKDVIIPGFSEKLAHFLVKFVPTRLVLPIEIKMQSQKLK